MRDRTMTQTDIIASKAYWDTRAPAFDDQYNALDVRQMVTRRVLDLMGPAHGKTILDLGIGTARLYRDNFQHFVPAEMIIGVELSGEMLARAESGMRAAGYQQFHALNISYTELEIKPNTVDIVVSTLSLHHIRDADKLSVLKHVMAALKNDGRLIIADQLNCTGREMTAEELRGTMVKTFFPDIPLSEALARTSHHKEYTCSLPMFAKMVADVGFRVATEKLADFVGIVTAQKVV